MQIDMHYYGTYAMARAAGLKKEVSKTIATAAQFVDDNAKNKDIKLKDGSCIHTIATAHHVENVKNLNKKDQRKVWVPFHFLPGNEGIDFSERSICRKNSQIMKEVIDFTCIQSDKDFFIEFVGIVAHVYADTFSHYGFSGFSHNRNKVDQAKIFLDCKSSDMNNHLKKKLKPSLSKTIRYFFDLIKAGFSEVASLGHGAVSSFPDRPYLSWEFNYEETGKKAEHNNPETFLEGCEALFNYFSKIGEFRPDLKDDSISRNFADISDVVTEILSLEEKKEERINEWIKRADEGVLFGSSEIIPMYGSWNNDIKQLEKMESEYVKKQKVYQFFQATSIYRTFVLRDLLPKYNLIVG